MNNSQISISNHGNNTNTITNTNTNNNTSGVHKFIDLFWIAFHEEAARKQLQENKFTHLQNKEFEIFIQFLRNKATDHNWRYNIGSRSYPKYKKENGVSVLDCLFPATTGKRADAIMTIKRIYFATEIDAIVIRVNQQWQQQETIRTTFMSQNFNFLNQQQNMNAANNIQQQIQLINDNNSSHIVQGIRAHNNNIYNNTYGVEFGVSNIENVATATTTPVNNSATVIEDDDEQIEIENLIDEEDDRLSKRRRINDVEVSFHQIKELQQVPACIFKLMSLSDKFPIAESSLAKIEEKLQQNVKQMIVWVALRRFMRAVCNETEEAIVMDMLRLQKAGNLPLFQELESDIMTAIEEHDAGNNEAFDNTQSSETFRT